MVHSCLRTVLGAEVLVGLNRRSVDCSTSVLNATASDLTLKHRPCLPYCNSGCPQSTEYIALSPVSPQDVLCDPAPTSSHRCVYPLYSLPQVSRLSAAGHAPLPSVTIHISPSSPILQLCFYGSLWYPALGLRSIPLWSVSASGPRAAKRLLTQPDWLWSLNGSTARGHC